MEQWEKEKRAPRKEINKRKMEQISKNSYPIHENQRKPTPRMISKLLWSWPFVGFVLSALIGGGFNFITSGSHPYIADFIFILCAILFLLAFFKWEAMKYHPRRRGILTAIFVITITIVGIITYWSHYLNWSIESVHFGELTVEKQLNELDRLFVSKDEWALREMFAFQLMLESNIGLVRQRVKSFRETGVKEFNITKYTRGKQLIIDIEIAGENLRRYGGGGIYELDPNEVSMIVLPIKYTQAKQILISYENSTVLPIPVIEAVKHFDLVIDNNMRMLIKLLDNLLKTNPDYYLYYDDFNSPYWTVINGLYWTKFVDLRPEADKIRDAIRQSLSIK